MVRKGIWRAMVPEPNPARNTGVGLGQQLSTPGNTITVLLENGNVRGKTRRWRGREAAVDRSRTAKINEAFSLDPRPRELPML